MIKLMLVINSGSSSIKFSLYKDQSSGLNLFYHGQISDLDTHAQIKIIDADKKTLVQQKLSTNGHEQGFKVLFSWLADLSLQHGRLIAVGHRVVHGGTYFTQPVIVQKKMMEEMECLIPLAPLHQPHNLEAIKIIAQLYPELPQIACFDTLFHQTQHSLAKLFALPRALTATGIIRYGFHGLSYEYIASVLPQYLGELAHEKIIVAHLGNGASMCALSQGKSIATTMGFTALDGLMMGTRTGSIDPGVVLYLLEHKNYSIAQVQHLLYNESGLLGVSGLTNNVQELLTHAQEPPVQEAIDLFCYRAAQEASALCVALGGCDALIFTAGIGENVPLFRQKICEYLAWMGIKLLDDANDRNAHHISAPDSKIKVGVIPTNEELMIARHVRTICENNISV